MVAAPRRERAEVQGSRAMVVSMKGIRGSSGVTCPLGGAVTQLKICFFPVSKTAAAGAGSLLKQDPSFFPSWQRSGCYGDMVLHPCLQEGQAQLPAGSSLWC